MPDSSELLPAVADEAAQARSLLRLMNKGLRIAEPSISGTVGAAIGLLGGPPGAILGGFVGGAFSTAVKKLASEMDKRFMGPREEARVGAVCALGAAEIVERINAGDKLREDGFFDEGDKGRSDAEEVWEGLLSKCQREASERKLPYMGHMFAGLAFHESIGLDLAHQVISEAERLSYRQLCILRVCAVRDSFDLRSEPYVSTGQREVTLSSDVYPVLLECFDLCNRGFLGSLSAVLTVPQIVPSAMSVQGIGAFIHNLMKLDLVPEEDLSAVAERLR